MAKQEEKIVKTMTKPTTNSNVGPNDAGRERDPLYGLAPGRVVHYVLPNGDHRPAMVVHVLDRVVGRINVQQFVDADRDGHAANDGTIYRGKVSFDADGAADTWHWPERAE